MLDEKVRKNETAVTTLTEAEVVKQEFVDWNRGIIVKGQNRTKFEEEMFQTMVSDSQTMNNNSNFSTPLP